MTLVSDEVLKNKLNNQASARSCSNSLPLSRSPECEGSREVRWGGKEGGTRRVELRPDTPASPCIHTPVVIAIRLYTAG